MKKDKIIEFKIKKKITTPVRIDFFKDEQKIKIPLSRIIQKILPELRKEKKKFVEILEKHWGHMSGCEEGQIEAIFDYLNQKYGKKKTTNKKKIL